MTVSGYGLHGGAAVTATLKPAPADHGVVFQVRSGGRKTEIPALVQYLLPSERSTALARAGAAIGTVEHLLATCRGMGVDNCLVEVFGDELPGFDGSCRIWRQAMVDAGWRELPKYRKELVVEKPLMVSQDDSCLCISPAPVFGVRFLLDYSPSSTRLQWVSCIEQDGYFDGLAQARTFAFRWEVADILRYGLGQGVRDQAFLVGEAGEDPANLRMPGEASYHKIVDIIGDIMLTGIRIRGEFVGIRSGHALNHRLAALLASGLNDEKP
ncbi:MAG TPA: UDP-3-O-acyl-N-acetylglucosamine deacetylase [Atribacteraceae bacterium]|nr:UDP-3-O-acyl-N-acetylglucosamine deacetylase [Atribacteraceae bacterium]